MPAIGFTEQMSVCFLKFLKKKSLISQMNEPIPGMFVLCWMHFSWWFQIWSWIANILTFFEIFWKFVPVVCSRLLHALVLLSKVMLLSQISEMLTSISWTNEPIPGMFVLCWMHISWWFQIWSWIAKILTIFEHFLKFVPVVCSRLLHGNC